MRILELQEYAKEHGINSLKFDFINFNGDLKKGRWIDAYYGLFWVEGISENEMITVTQWRMEVGDSIEFNVINQDVIINGK